MRVLAFHVNMSWQCALALGRYVPEEELQIIYTGENDYSYWNALFSRWDGSDDILTIEQDNEITARDYQGLKDCPEPWCVCWYKGPPFHEARPAVLTDGLGCTKISAEVQRSTQHLIRQDEQKWDIVDKETYRLRVLGGYDVHVHGQVKHHHRYEVTYLPSPSLINLRYCWRNLDKGEYPTMPPEPEPGNAGDSFIIDGAVLEAE